MVQPADNIPSLDNKVIKIFQGIVGALLYVGRSVKKILLAFSEIWSQQAAATVETEDVIEKLLDYVATYPDDGIIFRKSDMIFAAHADKIFLNE